MNSMNSSAKKMFPIVLSVIVLDIATKNLADSFGWSVVNKGISGGIGEGVSPYLLIGLGVLNIVLIWNFFWKALFREKESLMLKEVGFSLWLGGALANMVDRVVIGGVRDWIRLPFFAVYNNVADWVFFIGLCIGIWLFLKSYRQHTKMDS